MLVYEHVQCPCIQMYMYCMHRHTCTYVYLYWWLIPLPCVQLCYVASEEYGRILVQGEENMKRVMEDGRVVAVMEQRAINAQREGYFIVQVWEGQHVYVLFSRNSALHVWTFFIAIEINTYIVCNCSCIIHVHVYIQMYMCKCLISTWIFHVYRDSIEL